MKTNLKDLFPKNIFIIGCGGTGSHFASRLPHILSEARALGFIDSIGATKIWFIDHDIVEPKNLTRQVFTIEEIQQVKSAVLRNRYHWLNVATIPEAMNALSLPLVFTDEVLSSNFCVISMVDKREVSSQIYQWLVDNAHSKNRDICWTWLFSGGQLKKQTVKSQLRQFETEIETAFITTYLYGMLPGHIPLTPVSPKILYPDLLVDLPEGAIGVNSDGQVIGCGMGIDQDVKQASEMNGLAACHLHRVFNWFYFNGLVVSQYREENGEARPTFLCSTDELLYPEEFPQLVEDIQSFEPITSEDYSGPLMPELPIIDLAEIEGYDPLACTINFIDQEQNQNEEEHNGNEEDHNQDQSRDSEFISATTESGSEVRN